MVDRIKPLKLEDPADGGDDLDLFPTSLNPNEDYLDCRGITLQSDSSDDDTVGITRDAAGKLAFKDTAHPTGIKLEDVGETANHPILRQLIHFIGEGPAEGFATGAYREVTGTAFPTAIVWWESASKLKKIVEQTISWTGVNPTTVVWKIYDTDGVSVLATVTDSVSYTGPFETARTRAIVVS
jgi:hypothetical protein